MVVPHWTHFGWLLQKFFLRWHIKKKLLCYFHEMNHLWNDVMKTLNRNGKEMERRNSIFIWILDLSSAVPWPWSQNYKCIWSYMYYYYILLPHIFQRDKNSDFWSSIVQRGQCEFVQDVHVSCNFENIFGLAVEFLLIL